MDAPLNKDPNEYYTNGHTELPTLFFVAGPRQQAS